MSRQACVHLRCHELWARFRRSTFCRMNRAGGKACSRTTNACLSSNCFELWARFRRSAFCRMNRSGGKACSRTMNACLCSNCFELWASFCRSKDCDSLFAFKLFRTVGEFSPNFSPNLIAMR